MPEASVRYGVVGDGLRPGLQAVRRESWDVASSSTEWTARDLVALEMAPPLGAYAQTRLLDFAGRMA